MSEAAQLKALGLDDDVIAQVLASGGQPIMFLRGPDGKLRRSDAPSQSVTCPGCGGDKTVPGGATCNVCKGTGSIVMLD